jgi:hypothetical protein
MMRNETAKSQRVIDAFKRYSAELKNMPAAGGGGCHTSLLRIANFGRMADVNPEQIARDLTANIHGNRKVTEREIRDAVKKAFDTFPLNARLVRSRTTLSPSTVNGRILLNAILERGSAATEASLWEMSPVRIDWPPDRDAVEILRNLYRPEDLLFIGARHEAGPDHVLSSAQWIRRFGHGRVIPEHLIPNPLTGMEGLTKSRTPSFRADSCVTEFRFAVIEFDTMVREQQIQFFAGVKLPIVALLDSGGKSIHGWIRIDATSAGRWTERVEDKLFTLLTAIGADNACKNESRLSRMPGHFRAEKNRWQRVLYLNPKGGPLIP